MYIKFTNISNSVETIGLSKTNKIYNSNICEILILNQATKSVR